MKQQASHLSRFLRAVHRRMMIVRAIEGAGAGLAISAGLALILAVSLLWLGREAMQLCVAALFGGAIIGASWPMLRRPTILAAAVEADRQLELADLLATAWMRRDNDDPWQRAVIAMAEERCRSLSPSAVMLARFGTRAWSGIGLAAALVLTIGALSTSPRQTVATTPDALSAVMRDARDRERASQSPAALPRVKAHAGGDSQRAAQVSPDESQTAGERAALPAHRGSETGGGSASAQTSSSDASPPRQGALAAGSSDPDAADVGSGGARQIATGQGAAAGSATSSDAISPAPPWSASSPVSDRAAAEEQIRTGQIKDEYRDVVRRYFDGR